MASYLTPGIYIEEKATAQPIDALSTSVAAFIGVTVKGPVNHATFVGSIAEFVKIFGGPMATASGGALEHYLYYAVRLFFAEGGTKCYVVRVAGYGDINVASSLQAQPATLDFAALALPATPVPKALAVSAISPGSWGAKQLAVQIESASKFSVLLEESVVGADKVTQIVLKDNPDVQVGSLLEIVEQVTGTVKSVDADAGSITFHRTVTAEAAPGDATPAMSFSVAKDTPAFTPDMKLLTTAIPDAPVVVKVGETSEAIKLSSVQRFTAGRFPLVQPDKTTGGKTALKAGDVINFATKPPAFVVVTRLAEKRMASGARAVIAEFAPTKLPDFDHRNTKVYARDFDLVVCDPKVVVEVHTHLSLINTNRRDYVDERMAPGKAASALVVANEGAGTNGALITDTLLTPLAGGDDGLKGSPAFGDDDIIGSEASSTGLSALDALDDISMLVIPNAAVAVAKAAIAYCENRKDLFFITERPRESGARDAGLEDLVKYVADLSTSYAAIYYPWIVDVDPATGKPVTLPPSGAVAGIYARTDVARGVHKAPAGMGTGQLRSPTAIERIVTKAENDMLYQKRINVIRSYPDGLLVWGARTLSPTTAWRYVNVRRLFIFLEQSIGRGLKWVVFEPNNPSLWKSIKRNVAAFLRVQWEEGKLVGTTEEKAFFVRCDSVTNPPDTMNVGQVIAEIGVAPSKPAEFVVFRFKQFVGTAK